MRSSLLLCLLAVSSFVASCKREDAQAGYGGSNEDAYSGTKNLPAQGREDAGRAHNGKRVALVIGVNRYTYLADSSQLRSPVADATDVAAALKGLGYSLTTGTALTDASRETTVAAIERFASEAYNAEAAVFYFSGHGIQVGEDNYLLPADAPRLNGLSMLRNRGVLLREAVMIALEEANTKHKVIVLDCCRDNPFSAQLDAALASVGKSLKTKSVGEITGYGPGFYLAFATSPGTTAEDGNGRRNSPFTAAMLKSLRTGAEQDIDFFFRDVKAAMGREQVSWTNHSLQSTFTLARPKAEKPGAASSPLTATVPSAAVSAPASASSTAARTRSAKVEIFTDSTGTSLATDSVETELEALDAKLVKAWQAVREKDSQPALESAQAVFESVLQNPDPVIAYQGEAGLAAIESIMQGGGPQEKVRLYAVPGEGGTSSSALWGLIDRAGAYVVPPRYRNEPEFKEGLAFVQAGTESGFINARGEMVITGVREGSSYSMPYFSEGLAWAYFPGQNKRGYIDRTGKIALPVTEDVGAFMEGLAMSRAPLLYDRKGTKLEAAGWTSPGPFSEGLAQAGGVSGGSLSGYINRRGQMVIPPKWEGAGPFREGLAQVGKAGWIDRRGRRVIPGVDFTSEGPFSEGLAPMMQGSGYGFVDRKGKVAVRPVWSRVRQFVEGLAFVEENGKWGCIDPMGQIVVPAVWDVRSDRSGPRFVSGLARVYEKMSTDSSSSSSSSSKPDRMCYIDQTGKVIWSSDGKGIGTYGPLSVAVPPPAVR